MKKLFNIVIILIVAIPLSAQEDITPPTLTGFSFTPSSIDVTSGTDTVTVTVSATDDLSGLSYVSVSFRSPSGDQYANAGMHTYGALDTTVSDIMTIAQYAEGGDWEVDFVSIDDQVGNSYNWYTSELDSMGFSTILTVTSVQDVTPPHINRFYLHS